VDEQLAGLDGTGSVLPAAPGGLLGAEVAGGPVVGVVREGVLGRRDAVRFALRVCPGDRIALLDGQLGRLERHSGHVDDVVRVVGDAIDDVRAAVEGRLPLPVTTVVVTRFSGAGTGHSQVDRTFFDAVDECELRVLGGAGEGIGRGRHVAARLQRGGVRVQLALEALVGGPVGLLQRLVDAGTLEVGERVLQDGLCDATGRPTRVLEDHVHGLQRRLAEGRAGGVDVVAVTGCSSDGTESVLEGLVHRLVGVFERLVVPACAGLEVLERALCDGLGTGRFPERIDGGGVEPTSAQVRGLGTADGRRRACRRLELEERRLRAVVVGRDGLVVAGVEGLDQAREVLLLEAVIEVLAGLLHRLVDVEFVGLEALEQRLADAGRDAALTEPVPLTGVREAGAEERGPEERCVRPRECCDAGDERRVDGLARLVDGRRVTVFDGGLHGREPRFEALVGLLVGRFERLVSASALEVSEHVADHRRGAVGLTGLGEPGRVRDPGAIESQASGVGVVRGRAARRSERSGVPAARLERGDVASAGDHLRIGERVAPVDCGLVSHRGLLADRVGVVVLGGRRGGFDTPLEGLVRFGVGIFERVVDGGLLEALEDGLCGGSSAVEVIGPGERGGVECRGPEQLKVEHRRGPVADERALRLGEARTRQRRFLARAFDVTGVESGCSEFAEGFLEALVLFLARVFEHLVGTVLPARTLEAGEGRLRDCGTGRGFVRETERERVPHSGPHRVPLGSDGDLSRGRPGRLVRLLFGHLGRRSAVGAGPVSGLGLRCCVGIVVVRESVTPGQPHRCERRSCRQYVASALLHRSLGSPKESKTHRSLGVPKRWKTIVIVRPSGSGCSRAERCRFR